MKQMPKDTILFKKDSDHAVAFNYNYFKNYYANHYNDVYEAIYYKAGNERDTWIDYSKTIGLKTGTRNERILQAVRDENFLINFYAIPETNYYDENGFNSLYSPYDGYYDNEMWLSRIQFDYDAIQFSMDEDDLYVTFSEKDNIENAILSLNMIFYNYEVIGSNKVLFKNIKSYLATSYGMDSTKKDIVDIKINAYAWDGLLKRKKITPSRKVDHFFYCDVSLEYNMFIIYNGVMYNYIIDDENKKRFTIPQFLDEEFDSIELDKIAIYRMQYSDPKMECKLYQAKGINNKYLNSVDFLLPVQNSLITLNGIDHTYTVEDICAISYPNTLYSIFGLNNTDKVVSVNFTVG